MKQANKSEDDRLHDDRITSCTVDVNITGGIDLGLMTKEVSEK